MAFLLQQLLRQSAARLPDKLAVVCRDEQLTYRELDDLSNRLAHLLHDNGVQPGDRVGLLFPKSVRSVVAMFGVLKAGAAYVPVDPQAPLARAARILRNCQARGVITTGPRAEGLHGTWGDEGITKLLLLVDATGPRQTAFPVIPWADLARYGAGAPPSEGGIETDLAYILYTSGSTGEPKGVMLTHRNALTFIDWCAETFRVGSDDRLSNHAPLHFDLSVFDIYNAIGAGATVFMVDEETAVFPSAVASFIERHRLTIWYSVPSALVQLLLHGDLAARDLSRLRLLLYAGEPFPGKHLQAITEVVPRTRVFNLYGPTETNVCTFYEVPVPLPPGIDRIPIGRACANFEVLALDGDGREIRPGEEGELYVRSPSVTPGYWGDAARTAAGVLPNPGRPYLGDRAYRTGDIVTKDEDGNLVFLRRRDHMIKSRGYRIELGEIEAALYSEPSVVEAAAVAVPDDEVGNRIWAFVVLKESGAHSEAELLAGCARRLPRYMVPERLEVRDRLPKTSTGKTDRQRLVATRRPGEEAR
jgi:amino acid adenylation domain-containing protein